MRHAITAENLMNQLWHGSKLPRQRLVAGYDHGIHLGTREQALMRNSAFLHRVSFSGDRVRRSKDLGMGWGPKIRDARRFGFDAISYLNRYEGLSNEDIVRISEHRNPDGLTDGQFRKLAPSARESVIALAEEDVRVIEVVPGPGRVLMYHGTSVENVREMAEKGFSPEGWRAGPNGGRRGMLYLTDDPVNAQWFADRTGEGCVISLSVRACDLVVDPEDGMSNSVVEEMTNGSGPSYLATMTPIPAHLIRVLVRPEIDASPVPE